MSEEKKFRLYGSLIITGLLYMFSAFSYSSGISYYYPEYYLIKDDNIVINPGKKKIKHDKHINPKEKKPIYNMNNKYAFNKCMKSNYNIHRR